MPYQGTTVEGRTAAQTATDAANASGGNPLLTKTAPEADIWIDQNVQSVTVGVVRQALKIVAHLLILLRDRQAAIMVEQKAIKRRIEALESR